MSVSKETNTPLAISVFIPGVHSEPENISAANLLSQLQNNPIFQVADELIKIQIGDTILRLPEWQEKGEFEELLQSLSQEEEEAKSSGFSFKRTLCSKPWGFTKKLADKIYNTSPKHVVKRIKQAVPSVSWKDRSTDNGAQMHFPIKIRLVGSEESILVKIPEDLPVHTGFTVLETNVSD